MSVFAAANSRDRLPVSLVTGFLGSGKTTLVNRLLRHPAMARTAVVINEFGETPLDQLFIETSDGEVTVLANGCLCCTVQGELEDVVGTLFGKRARGDIPAFDRMLIETTGLADPAPIMQLLLAKPIVCDNFALDAVIATVDAVHGERQLREHDEAVKQAALADRIVITKTDLAAPGAIEARIAALNPGATVLRLPNEDFAPAFLFGGEHNRASWQAAAAHDHLHGIETYTLRIDEPVAWETFSRWLTRFKIRHADRLLRVKGIVTVAGEADPVAIHGVHHVFHPPERLAHVRSDGGSRIVFITRGLPGAAIEADWRAFAAAPALGVARAAAIVDTGGEAARKGQP